MKTGDLVKWTSPGHENMGLIIDMWKSNKYADEQPLIMWFDGYGNGPYPMDHKYLELINASPK